MLWKQRERSEYYDLFRENGYGKLTAIALCNAGVTNLNDAWDFLHGDELISPSKIRNIDKATDIIWNHIIEHHKICVFGDYDADGITASAIMFLALKKLGANVVVRLPDRIEEGYGISRKAIEEQLELGVELFITVDNGIKAVEETAHIREQGCEIVILDHHEPGDVLPDANALIDLHIPGETYPFIELTGSGLAWKVAHYMLEMIDEHDFALSLVDLAAIGTIGDVAPLVGENRVIVKRALKRMKECTYNRPGIKALMNDLSNITATDIAFSLAPCLNASGRLKSRGAELPLIFLLETDESMASQLATLLRKENDKRKEIQAVCYEKIKGAAEKQIADGNKVIVLCDETTQSGIVGLLAGKLAEDYHRPAIVFCPKTDISGNTIWTGSARSIEGFHILNAIDECKEYLLGFGGHSLAAGMSMEPSKEKLQAFCKAINELAAVIPDEQLVASGLWDIEVGQDEVEELIEEAGILEPHGAFAPKPVVKTRVTLNDKGRHMFFGKNKEHLRLFADDFHVKGFFLADKYIANQLPVSVMCYGNVGYNHFAGRCDKELFLLDFEA